MTIAGPEAGVTRDWPKRRLGQLGMLADGLYLGDEGRVVFGIKSAVMGFVRALLQHGSFEGCDLFASDAILATSKEEIARSATSRPGPSTAIWPLTELPQRVTRARPFAFHDATGDLCRLPYTRSHVAPGPYPITVIHYTVSYVRWRYQMLLPLLMAGFRRYDAIVCNGGAARTAVAALIEQIQESLDAEYGLKLPFRGRLDVIPLGVDTAVFRPRDRTEARNLLGLPPDRLILLSLGRFSATDKMDLAPLLQVFCQLRSASQRKLLLVLAGSDPAKYSDAVRSLAQDLGVESDVQILTNLSPVIPPLLYAASDIFVSISDNVQEYLLSSPSRMRSCARRHRGRDVGLALR